MTHPTETFTVGDIISLTTGLALYGPATFARRKRLGEFRTGLPLQLETEPDVDSDDFMTLTGWQLAILQVDDGQLWQLMVNQYLNVLLFNGIRMHVPEREEDIPAMIATFKAESARAGIDLEREIRVSPLSDEERALAHSLFGQAGYQYHCVQAMLGYLKLDSANKPSP